MVAFYEGALEILAEDGYGGLKLAAVCQRLGVTTGAFYHHFDSWAEFTRQLLDHWHAERTTRLVAVVNQEPDARTRLKLLLETATTLPHTVEGAIRVWSNIDPDVERVQAAVDRERMDVVRATYESLVSPDEAEHFARTSLYLLTGHELGGEQRNEETLAWALQLLITSGSAGNESG